MGLITGEIDEERFGIYVDEILERVEEAAGLPALKGGAKKSGGGRR
jgi:hypothetical protein